MRHTDETKKKISAGVKRHYQNMSEADNERRKQRIAKHRQNENMALRFIQSHNLLIIILLCHCAMIVNLMQSGLVI